MSNIVSVKPLKRRHVLRGLGGISIALPLMDAMQPILGDAKQIKSPQRFVAICTTLGIHTPFLFPETEEESFKLTPYLEEVKKHRKKWTALSGICHPEQQGSNGHASELTWLTSAQRPGLAGFKNTISIDQLIANKIGVQTRFPYMALSTSGRSISWTSNGVEVPGERSPSKIFKAMFVKGTKEEVEKEMQKLQRGRSIMDTLLGEAKKLNHSLTHEDKHKLQEYLAAIRDFELRLKQTQDWSHKPKPKTDAKMMEDEKDKNKIIEKQNQFYDIISLAFKSDSTRTITFQISGSNSLVDIPGVETDWHNLSHHGKDPKKIKELAIIEKAHFKSLNGLLDNLANASENGQPLLDKTSVVFGSNLGNASSHSWRNIPLLLVGGGFKHKGHIAGDQENNTPYANLFVSIAQKMGLEIDSFGSSTRAGIKDLV